MRQDAAMVRAWRIADWVDKNGFDTAGIGISSRIVRFKESEEAMLFKLTCEEA